MYENVTDLDTYQKSSRFETIVLSKTFLNEIDLVNDREELYISKEWRGFTKRQLLSLQRKYNFPEYIKTEVMLDWVEHNEPIQKVVSDIWDDIKQDELNYTYIWMVKRHIRNLKYKIPVVNTLDQYRHTCYECSITHDHIADLIDNKPIYLSDISVDCKIPGCTKPGKHVVPLHLIDTIPCYTLNVENIVDPDIGHSHKGSMVHWCVSYFYTLNWLSSISNDHSNFTDLSTSTDLKGYSNPGDLTDHHTVNSADISDNPNSDNVTDLNHPNSDTYHWIYSLIFNSKSAIIEKLINTDYNDMRMICFIKYE